MGAADSTRQIYSRAPGIRRPPDVRVFCDFDGTLAAEDIGNAFFRHFAPQTFTTLLPRFLSGDVTSRELCAAYACELPSMDDETLDAFCASFSLRDGAVEFVQWCTDRGIPFTILSDGLDAYITRVLSRHGLSVPLYSNTLHRLDNGWRIDQPWSDAECSRCGCCKRNRMALMTPDDALIVLIGDGRSDTCPSEYADLVFARASLETWCREHNITFRAFRSFSDIPPLLTASLSVKRPNRSRRAAVLRNELWKRG